MKPVQKKNMAYTLFCWVFAAVFAGIWLGAIVNNRTSYYQYRVLPIVVCGAAALPCLYWRAHGGCGGGGISPLRPAGRRRLWPGCWRLILPCSLAFLS